MADTLHGRIKLYTAIDELTSENVISELSRVLGNHAINALDEEYLYWYRRGVQPILQRTKERNSFICNKTVVNFADQAVTFRNGYFLTKPAKYMGRADYDKEKVDALNRLVDNSGKHRADNKIADWFHTVGVGVLFIAQGTSEKKPFECYAIDPRSAAVVYSLSAGNRPKYCFNMTMVSNNEVIFDVYSEKRYFKLRGGYGDINSFDPQPRAAMPYEVIEERVNQFGLLPMVEYFANENRTSCFEMAIPCMNEYNQVESDRADGLEQFIQSLLVLRGIDVEDGIDADFIKKHGMLCLPLVGDKMPDAAILAEQLDQTGTQITLDSLKDQIHAMCGIPNSLSTGRGSFENVGAAYMDRGYAICDTINRNTIDCWTESNEYATEVILRILAIYGLDIDISELDINFPPNEIDNLLVRTQAAVNMKQIGLAPELVLVKSGLSNDPVSDVQTSKEYIAQAWASPKETEVIADV